MGGAAARVYICRPPPGWVSQHLATMDYNSQFFKNAFADFGSIQNVQEEDLVSMPTQQPNNRGIRDFLD